MYRRNIFGHIFGPLWRCHSIGNFEVQAGPIFCPILEAYAYPFEMAFRASFVTKVGAKKDLLSCYADFLSLWRKGPFTPVFLRLRAYSRTTSLPV